MISLPHAVTTAVLQGGRDGRPSGASQALRGAAVPTVAGLAVLAALSAAPVFGLPVRIALALAAAGFATLARLLCLAHVRYRMAVRSRSDLRDLYHSTLRCLAAAIDARDCHAKDHVLLVEFVACEIARELGLDEEESEGLRTAALLLDIGTLGVPEHILLQSGRPTPDEFASIHNHPIIGAQVLEDVAFPWPVQRIIRSHHERWDGDGYPDRLKGDEIPLGSRILAVADVYSALMSNRSYRRGWTHEQAMAHIRRGSGGHFDPAVVKVFLRIAYKIPRSGLCAGTYSGERMSSSIARANQEFVGLWELSQSASNSLDLEHTLEAVAWKISEFLDSDACAIFLKETDGTGLRCECEYPRGNAGLMGYRASLGDAGTGAAARDGRPVIIRPSRDCLCGSGSDAPEQAFAWAAIAPLRSGSSTLGTINLYRKERDFSIEELDLLNALARHAAVPIGNASLYEEARQSAECDPLTGLHNVRYLCSRAEQEFARATRIGRPFSIIAVDLDHFKAVNDTLGHQAGDALLRDMSQLFASAVRDYDSVVRYGGDEFVVILPEASAEDAADTVRRLDCLVRDYASRLPGLVSVGFGASFGSATFPEDGRDMKGLLAAADARMYRSKREHGGGREAA